MNIRAIDAINYLKWSVQNNYIDEEYAHDLIDLPWEEMVEEVDKLIGRGDNYVDQLKEME